MAGPVACVEVGCGYLGVRKFALKYHRRKKHGSGPAPAQCPHCTSIFVHASRLRFHIKETHLKEKTHACTWPGCLKSYSRARDLKEHVNSHTGVCDYPCGAPRCDEAFTYSKAARQCRKSHQKK